MAIISGPFVFQNSQSFDYSSARARGTKTMLDYKAKTKTPFWSKGDIFRVERTTWYAQNHYRDIHPSKITYRTVNLQNDQAYTWSPSDFPDLFEEISEWKLLSNWLDAFPKQGSADAWREKVSKALLIAGVNITQLPKMSF